MDWLSESQRYTELQNKFRSPERLARFLLSQEGGPVSFPHHRVSRGAYKVTKRLHTSRLGWQMIGSLVVWGILGVSFAGAQAAGEYAGAVSSMGSAGVGAAQPKVPNKLPAAAPAAAPAGSPAQAGSTAKPGAKFKHLPARNGEPVEVMNRRELERQAGRDAGKLLIRSSSSAEAIAWINGKLVGSTPLLMLLAPGQYKVELRGARSEFAQGNVDLLPNETRELVMELEQRYPSQVRLR